MFGDVTFAQAPFAALGGNTYSFAVSESAVALSVLSAETALGGLLEESAAGVSTVSNFGNFFQASSSETATATDAQTAAIAVLAALAEQANASEAYTTVASVFATQAETATAADSSTRIATYLVALSELATALDASNGTRIFAVAVSESAAGSADQSVQVAFVGTVSELANAADSLSAIATINANVTGVQLYVRIGDALVWGSIDDNQNPNWQNIDNTQTPGWNNLPS